MLQETEHDGVGSDHQFHGSNQPATRQRASRKPRRGRSRNLNVQVDDFMQRAEQFFYDGDLEGIPSTKHYDEQKAVLENALHAAQRQLAFCTDKDEEPSRIALKPLFMEKVRKYYDRKSILRARERLRRRMDIDVTEDEFRMVEKHFCNEKERDPDPKIAHRNSTIKGKYRKALEKNPNDPIVLQLMKDKGWTMKDLKRNRLPGKIELETYLSLIRSGKDGGESSCQVPCRGNRSNTDLEIDLNLDAGDNDKNTVDQSDCITSPDHIQDGLLHNTSYEVS